MYFQQNPEFPYLIFLSKKLLKIIGKEDTEEIMKNNFLTKEAFKKLLDNEDMVITLDYSDEEESSNFTIILSNFFSTSSILFVS